MKSTHSLILSCEHAGREVPPAYAHLFQDHQAVLTSHRGYDIGAIELAADMAAQLDVPLVAGTTTRLIVDLNRSSFSKTLFSEFMPQLGPEQRSQVLEEYYYPHREHVEALIQKRINRHEVVVHLGIHTFTPELHGKVRQTDIGLLYHPSSLLERRFCRAWEQCLREVLPQFRTRKNYPYLGDSDSFPSYLRRLLPKERYLGLQLEVNQRFPLSFPKEWSALRQGLSNSLKQVLSRWHASPNGSLPE